MSTTGVFPGSFDPWHAGHQDVLDKALNVFDNVIIAQGVNPDKKISERERLPPVLKVTYPGRVRFAAYTTTLVDFIKSMPEATAIIRGLRNGKDLENERSQQFWNEDLAKEIGYNLPPTVYFITDRSLIHISSSAIRVADKLKKGRK